MVAKDPQDRFQSMGEVIVELQKCVGQDPDLSTLTQSKPSVSVQSGADESSDYIDDDEVRETDSGVEDSEITEFPTADTELPTEPATSPDTVETATRPGRPGLTLHVRWPRIPLRRENKLITGVSAIVIVAAVTVWLVFFCHMTPVTIIKSVSLRLSSENEGPSCRTADELLALQADDFFPAELRFVLKARGRGTGRTVVR